ncbi:SUR7/PalI family [Teratosphaeria destructans]|uniref:SUR7/PalI family n=1 Tax=Teratosphaeria destructans TaxID=418781 RepID=A0A9W7SVM5_9PEZI|nr:SUR7/PalI family [Teratosphaeria destructans]
MALRDIFNRGGKMAANKAFGRATGMATGAVAGKVKLALALAGVLFAVTTLILSFLCLLAGHTPGFLENYALVTLDTSQIGENIIHKIDSKILTLTNLKRDLETVTLPMQTLLAAPSGTQCTIAAITPAAQLVERNADSVLSNLGSDLSEATSKVGSAANEATSKAGAVASEATSKIKSATKAAASKLTSATGAIGSAATSEVAKIAKEVVEKINDKYQTVISAANLSDFTSFHLLAACHGTYEFNNGTNITVGDVAQYNATGLHKHVDYCQKQSDLHLVLLAIAILYIIGIIFISASFALGILGAVKSSFARWAFYFAVGAFLFVFLATLAAHGIAHGAVKIISFIGGPINVKGQVGAKFLAMSWANTVLLAIAAAIWGTMFFAAQSPGALIEKCIGRGRKAKNQKLDEDGEKHDMQRFGLQTPSFSNQQHDLAPLPHAHVSGNRRTPFWRKQQTPRNECPETDPHDSESV